MSARRMKKAKNPRWYLFLLLHSINLCVTLLFLYCCCLVALFLLYYILEFFIHLSFHNNNDRSGVRCNKTVLFYVCEIQEPNKTKFAMNANRSARESLQCCNTMYVKMYIWTLNKYVNAFHTHSLSLELLAC